MKKLGVIFGGTSVEHEISIISALQAIESLDESKYEIHPIYISKKNNWYSDPKLRDIEIFKDMSNINNFKEISLTNEEEKVVIKYKKKSLFSNDFVTEIDAILVVVHGTNVEDGKLQGYLDTIGAKYSGVDTYAAVVGQDKAYMRDIFKANDINQVKYLWVTDNMDYDYINKQIKDTCDYPVIIKPALLGSSVGIEIVKDESQLESALDESFSYGTKLVIEEFINEFREMNIAVLGNYKNISLSKIEEVAKADEILSYQDKYQSNSKSKNSGMASLDRIIPAKITSELESKIHDVASRAFKALGSSGVVRIDLMIFNNEVYVNEVNNIPGSLSFYLWDSYPQLLDQLIDLGVNRYFENNKKQFSFDTNVLQLSGKGTKK